MEQPSEKSFLNKLSSSRAWFWLYALCFATRVIYIAAQSENLTELVTEYEMIADTYLIHGQMLFSMFGQLLPTAFMPPGLIFLLIFLKKFLPGTAYLWIALLQIVLATSALYFIRRIGTRIFGPTVALLSGALYVLDINLFIPVAWINETLYTYFFVLAYMAFAIDLTHRPNTINAMATGFFLAVGCLFRSTLVVHLIVTLGWLLLAVRARKGVRIRHIGVVLVTFILVILPWTIRNYRVFGKFVPISQNLGNNLWQGWNPLSGGSEFALSGSFMEMEPELKTALSAAKSEPEIDHILVRYAVDCARQDPARWMKQRILSYLFFWHQHNFWATHRPYSSTAWFYLGLIDLVFIGTFFLSLFCCAHLPGPPRYLLAIIFSQSLLYGLIHADIGSRFRYQIEPLMLFFIAAGVFLPILQVFGKRSSEK